MHQELENHSIEDFLFLEKQQRASLRNAVLRAVFRFPKFFDRSLYKDYEKFVVNCPADFLEARSQPHLQRILCFQFLLGKKMETAFMQVDGAHWFLKLFRSSSRICIALIYSDSFAFKKDQLMRTLDTLLPSIIEVPKSSYLWHSSEFPYSYVYFEVEKLRGQEVSKSYLTQLENSLKKSMQMSSTLTPALFWPYNKEESYRQVQLLVKEIIHEQDKPQISIHFKEQTSWLEFLIHFVRPKADSFTLEKKLASLYFFQYSYFQISTPFSIEISVFSVKISAQMFEENDSINLLYARRYLVKQLELAVGSFRDFNGGLLEKQQDYFEELRIQFGNQIPYFDLFAEKVFYNLHPYERWFSLSKEEIEDLFRAFSSLICDPKSSATRMTKHFTIIKKRPGEYGPFTIGGICYECYSGSTNQFLIENTKELRLAFQEGPPPSLNPHYSSSDMRSRLVNKMLFEGLTRLNGAGEPELTGASSYEKSTDERVYTFHLRETSWSNGEKVRSDQYAHSWRAALESFISHPEVLFCIKNAKKYWEKKCGFNEVGIQVIDRQILKVELESPDPEFLHKLSQPLFFPLFKSKEEPKWFNGPYLIQEMQQTELKLTRNPYYWGSQKFENIEIAFVKDVNAIFSLFKDGKIDWIGDPTSVLTLEQIKTLEKEQLLQKKNVSRRLHIFFNTRHPILASKEIRQALHLAIDRAYICKEIYPHSIPIQESSFSRTLAKTFLEEGLRKLQLSSFPPLIFSYSDHARREELAKYLEKAWNETLGIEIRLQKKSWDRLRSDLEKKNFEICCAIENTTNKHLVAFWERFEGDNSYNFSGWSNLVYRKLLEQAQLTKKQCFLDQAQKILEEQTPHVSLFDYVHLFASHSKLGIPTSDDEGCIDFTQGERNEFE